MSLAPNVLCRRGCGDLGDPELAFLCGDCYSDKVEMDRQKELCAYVDSKKSKTTTSIGQEAYANTAELPSRSRRGPPKVDHRKAFEEFTARPRERDTMVVARECLFMERETQIRNTSRLQLRRYMVATDVDDPVDPKEWGRYQFGAPRDAPRNDVDSATELAAQIKLFCHWRKRTLNRRIDTRRQLNEEKRRSDAEALRAFNRSQRRSTLAKLLPKLSTSKHSLSIMSLRKSISTAALSGAGTDKVHTPSEGITAAPDAPSVRIAL